MKILILFVLLAPVFALKPSGLCGGYAPTLKNLKEEGGFEKKFKGFVATPFNVKHSQIPDEFTWGNIDGWNALTPVLNANTPQFCGACFLTAAVQTANDRIKVLKGRRQLGGEVLLSRQSMLNCGQPNELGQSCNGGSALHVYEFMHRHGLPDDSCQTWTGRPSGSCDDISMCHNCMPVDGVQKCWPITNFTRYYVQEYGVARGEKEIMSEVFARGPVVCPFVPSPDFMHNYTGGVYVPRKHDKNTDEMAADHWVEIVGWGETADGTPFWHARNTWGRFWGNNGNFKILRGHNTLHIESECVFAIFDLSNERRVIEGELIGGMNGLHDKPEWAQEEDDDAVIYGRDHSFNNINKNNNQMSNNNDPGVRVTDENGREIAPQRVEYLPARMNGYKLDEQLLNTIAKTNNDRKENREESTTTTTEDYDDDEEDEEDEESDETDRHRHRTAEEKAADKRAKAEYKRMKKEKKAEWKREKSMRKEEKKKRKEEEKKEKEREMEKEKEREKEKEEEREKEKEHTHDNDHHGDALNTVAAVNNDIAAGLQVSPPIDETSFKFAAATLGVLAAAGLLAFGWSLVKHWRFKQGRYEASAEATPLIAGE